MAVHVLKSILLKNVREYGCACPEVHPLEKCKLGTTAFLQNVREYGCACPEVHPFENVSCAQQPFAKCMCEEAVYYAHPFVKGM